MTAMTGYYFDGRSAQRHPAALTLAGGEARLRLAEEDRRWQVRELLISPRTGAPTRLITLPDGGQFQCADTAALNNLPQQDKADGIVAWLEQRWTVALAAVVLVAALLLAGYFVGLPAAARHIAQRIPLESESNLGEEVLSSMDRFGWVQPSLLPDDDRARLASRFDDLREGRSYEALLRLEFRDSMTFGANAFALPGGIIVITDELVELAESDAEVLAILAHEIGHIEQRHIIRSLIQNSVVAIAATAITGDAATLSAAVAGLPVVLVQTEYSRAFETEADTYAFDLLRANGISPAVFADMMERLQERYPAAEDDGLNFLSTHPLIAERIARARAAAVPE